MKYPIIRLAHRGFSGFYPENTLLAFQKAIDEGIDFLEMDLHLTKDRKVIVMHDESFERTTNGKGWVWDVNLTDATQLDAGQGEHIPTLTEVIDLVRPTSVRLCLELKYEPFTKDYLKSEPEALATTSEVIKILHQKKFIDRVVVTSFSPNVLRKAKELEPRLPSVLDPSPQDGSLTPKEVMEQVVPCANIVAYYYPHINKELMDEARLAGIQVWAWDPDDPEEMKRLINLGVHGVMTNRPDTLNSVLASIKSIPI
jgi:glycerophosphoryl diester phosphodiesterase